MDDINRTLTISDTTSIREDSPLNKSDPLSTIENKRESVFSSSDIQIPIEDLKQKTFDFLSKTENKLKYHTSPPSSEITKNEIDFLRRIMKKASEERDEKIEKARKYNWYHNILGTLGRVLSTLSGCAGLGSLTNLNPSDPSFPILLTLSLITLGSALASTMQDHLDYSSKTEANKSTAVAYNGIIMKIAQFLSTPGTSRKDVEIFTNSITLEMNVINTQEDL